MVLTEAQAKVRDSWQGSKEFTINVEGKDVVVAGTPIKEAPAVSSDKGKGRQKKVKDKGGKK